MMPDHELDDALRRRMAGLREADARHTPPFGEMMARARATIANGTPAEVVIAGPVVPTRAWLRRRTWIVGGPLLLAAGLAGIWLRPSLAADREFEKMVSEWSRTAARSLHSPTDGLLAVPGAEFLRRMPALGEGTGTPRRPS